MMVQKDMDMKPDWRDPLYKRKRAQSAVKFKWEKEIWNIKMCTLILYLMFLFIVLGIFLEAFGNLTAPIVRGVEEVLVNDEWDSVDGTPHIGGHSGANGFSDIANLEEYWMWVENVALGAVFSDPRPYRDASGVLRMSLPGSISRNVYPIGRPRFRQIRVNECSCLRDARSSNAKGKLKARVPMSKFYAGLSNDTCFYPDNKATANFTAGGKTYVYRNTLGPQTDPHVGSWGKLQGELYTGGGYSWDIPANKTLAMEEFQTMKDGHWIDLNTMAVFFEFSLYVSNYNTVLVGRMTLELDQMGMIMTHHEFQTIKLKLYNTWTSDYRVGFEVLYVIFAVYWMAEEMRQCCPCCRSRTGVEIEKMRRKGDSDPVDIQTVCFIKCCTSTERICGCCRGVDEARLAALNASEYFEFGYNTFDLIVYSSHIFFVGLWFYAAANTVAIDNAVRCQVNRSRCGNTDNNLFAEKEMRAVAEAATAVDTNTTDISTATNPDDFVAMMFQNAHIVDMQEIAISLILFCMVIKSAEHFITNDLYAKYYYIIIGMVARLFKFFLIFGISLFAFVFSTYVYMKDTSESEAYVLVAFFTQLQRSFGDMNFSEAYDMATGTTMILVIVIYFLFAFFMVILMMNLMVAIMSEAIEEVSAQAKARWCQNQHSMLQRLREGKSEVLPWLLLRCARYWYNSVYSVTTHRLATSCCCCCKKTRKGEVWYAVDMIWNSGRDKDHPESSWERSKDRRGACKADKLRAKIAFDALEYNHMRLQYNYGDRLAEAMAGEFKKTIDLWMTIDKKFQDKRQADAAEQGESKNENGDSEPNLEKKKLGYMPEHFSAIMNDGVDHAGWEKFVEDCNERYGKVGNGNDVKFWPKATEKTNDPTYGIDPMSEMVFGEGAQVRGLQASRQDSRGTSSFCNMFSTRLRVSLIWSKIQEDKARRDKAKTTDHSWKRFGCTHANADPLFIPAGGLFHVSGFQTLHLLYQLSKKARWCVGRLGRLGAILPAASNECRQGMTHRSSQVARRKVVQYDRAATILRDKKGWNTIKKDCFLKALRDLFKYVYTADHFCVTSHLV